MECINPKSKLIQLLQTYKRNRDSVSLQVLKTKYKAGYETLCKEICQVASDYIKEIVFHDIRIRKEFLMEAKEVIEQTIATSGMGKKFGYALFEKKEITILESHALQLREIILTALEPLYYEHICLYVTADCLQEPYNTPAIYNEVSGLFWEDDKWVKKQIQNTALLFFIKDKQVAKAL